jgi:hypothetical protein
MLIPFISYISHVHRLANFPMGVYSLFLPMGVYSLSFLARCNSIILTEGVVCLWATIDFHTNDSAFFEALIAKGLRLGNERETGYSRYCDGNNEGNAHRNRGGCENWNYLADHCTAPLSIWLVWLYCRSIEMGLPDPIRSDVHHSFSVLIRFSPANKKEASAMLTPTSSASTPALVAALRLSGRGSFCWRLLPYFSLRSCVPEQQID